MAVVNVYIEDRLLVFWNYESLFTNRFITSGCVRHFWILVCYQPPLKVGVWLKKLFNLNTICLGPILLFYLLVIGSQECKIGSIGQIQKALQMISNLACIWFIWTIGSIVTMFFGKFYQNWPKKYHRSKNSTWFSKVFRYKIFFTGLLWQQHCKG